MYMYIKQQKCKLSLFYMPKLTLIMNYAICGFYEGCVCIFLFLNWNILHDDIYHQRANCISMKCSISSLLDLFYIL